MNDPTVNLILASASTARGDLLRAAGVAFVQQPSDVDEAIIKTEMLAESASPEAIARALARVKAQHVAARYPNAVVIGADQILECGGRCFDKPIDQDAARDHLRQFRGCEHRLISAVVAVRGSDVHWEHHDEARLTMRSFTDAFLENYLESVGLEVLESVGAYRLEGQGAQLFDKVEGDYFTVLGLPLLPLLGYLRAERLLSP
jgi:septum formation protein